jgi:uncharacterized membrane protein YcjF (UPF0283 family)
MNKKNFITPAFLFITIFSLMTTLPGCGLIENIFKAGMWVGIIGVVVVIGIILLIVRSFGGK